MAARKLGLKKIKREEDSSHPKRPHGKEGRLWVSRNGAKQSIGANTKEELLQLYLRLVLSQKATLKPIMEMANPEN